MPLLFLFLAICFGVGAMVCGGYWSMIRSSYMHRHGIPRWKYFLWKPSELPAMIREERVNARMMFAGLAVAGMALGTILLVSWLSGSFGQ
jgi:hypothetical protein